MDVGGVGHVVTGNPRPDPGRLHQLSQCFIHKGRITICVGARSFCSADYSCCSFMIVQDDNEVVATIVSWYGVYDY
jgi:hypothetical protein